MWTHKTQDYGYKTRSKNSSRKVSIVSNANKIELFRKTDTTLVYKTSSDYAKELLNSRYKNGDILYIHVDRDTGFITAYINGDPNSTIHLSTDDNEFILSFCENER